MAPDDSPTADLGLTIGQWLGRVEQKVDNLGNKIDSRFERIEQRVDSLEQFRDERISTPIRLDAVEIKVDSLESWRDKLAGAAGVVKIAFGTSIVSAVLSVITLLALLTGSVKS